VHILSKATITSLVQLEYNAFEPACVPVCSFTLLNSSTRLTGGFIRLSDFRGSENQAPKTIEAIHNPDCDCFFRAGADDFKKIPGSPISYAVSNNIRTLFTENRKI